MRSATDGSEKLLTKNNQLFNLMCNERKILPNA